VIQLAQGATLGLGASAQPGPFQAYLLAQAARSGPLRALPLALVPLVSDPPIVAAVLAVLATVPPALLLALQIGGGGFVVWLGVGALRAALGRGSASAAGGGAGPRGFWRATLVNLTNPNAWIFWSVVGGPILTRSWRDAPARAIGFLAGFYLLLLGGNAALILLFGAAGRLGHRAERALGVISGIALVAFGGWQVVRGLAA
jgi:threonine/homoserine/homoserine lactone efflux protein